MEDKRRNKSIVQIEHGCRASLLAIDSKMIASSHVVYAFGSKKTGKLVYVGKTSNHAKRFDAYRSPNWCHNTKLKTWLLNNKDDVFISILHHGKDGLDEAEKKHIAENEGLFNIMSGGDQSWRNHVKKPWMAGIGVHCPSTIAISKLKTQDEKAKFLEFVRSLSDIERCVFEINVAMNIIKASPLGIAKTVNNWLDRCQDRLIQCMEAGA